MYAVSTYRIRVYSMYMQPLKVSNVLQCPTPRKSMKSILHAPNYKGPLVLLTEDFLCRLLMPPAATESGPSLSLLFCCLVSLGAIPGSLGLSSP